MMDFAPIKKQSTISMGQGSAGQGSGEQGLVLRLPPCCGRPHSHPLPSWRNHGTHAFEPVLQFDWKCPL